MPANSACWVPPPDQRKATLSPPSTRSSSTRRRSGKAVRKPATACFIMAGPPAVAGCSGKAGLWTTKPGANSASAAARSPRLQRSASSRSTSVRFAAAIASLPRRSGRGWCERVTRPERPVRRLRGGGRERGQVAHLAARVRVAFAVEVELDVGKGARRGPVGLAGLPEVAEQVGHRRGAELLRGAERQPADGTQLLLELAGQAGIDGEMARVVWPRR